MENLKSLSDNELHLSAISVAEREREVTLQLLKHLNEIERRHLFSKWACSSLHVYCVKELKMSDGQAGRRIAAARLLREVPVVEEKILSGDLTLTSAAQAHVFFAKEKRQGNNIDERGKGEIVAAIEAKSTREVTELLLARSPEPEVHLREIIKPKTPTYTEVKLHLDKETMVALEELKNIWSHAMPGANLSDVIKRIAQETLNRHNPARQHSRKITQQPVGAGVVRSSFVKSGFLPNSQKSGLSFAQARASRQPKAAIRKTLPIATRRQVFIRDQGMCTYKDPRTGERCNSRSYLEYDHIHARALGGQDTADNLRLLCKAHNIRHAINDFGWQKMRAHLEG